MYSIVYNQDTSNRSGGMTNIHTPAHDELVFVSPVLKNAGCPQEAGAALTWVAMQHDLRLVSRETTKMISRTKREITLKFVPAYSECSACLDGDSPYCFECGFCKGD